MNPFLSPILSMLMNIVGPLAYLTGFLAGANTMKRLLQLLFKKKWGVSVQPAWFMSAALIALLSLVLFVMGRIKSSLNIDPFVAHELADYLIPGFPTFNTVSFPLSAFWYSGVTVVLTLVYTAIAFGIAMLLGPSGIRNDTREATKPETDKDKSKTGDSKNKESEEASTGLPPISRSRLAHTPEAGLLLALDSAVGAGFWIRLYRHLGYFGEPKSGVEPRYRLWLTRSLKGMAWIKWLSLPAVTLGLTSAVWWTVGALFYDSLKRLLALPPKETVKEKKASPKSTTEDTETASGHRLIDVITDHAFLSPKRIEQADGTAPVFGSAPWPSPHNTSPLFSQVLALGAQGGFSAYRHQFAAAKALLDGKDVLLNTYPHTGKGTLMHLLVAEAALMNGGSALLIVRQRTDAKRHADALRHLAQQSGWQVSVRIHDVSNDDDATLDPSEKQPHVLLGTVDDLEQKVMTAARLWDQFFAHLSLVGILNIDDHYGARSASLAVLCDRLGHLTLCHSGSPHYFLCANGYYHQTEKLAESIVNRPLTVINHTQMGAPAGGHTAYLLPVEPNTLADVQRLVLEQSKRAPDSDVVVETETDDLSHLPLDIRHLAPNDRPSYILRTILPDHPLSAALFQSRSDISWLNHEPTLAIGCDNPSARSRALRLALIEGALTRETLETHYGKTVTENEIAVLKEAGLILEETLSLFDAKAGLPQKMTRYRLADPTRVRLAAASEVVTNDPFALMDAGTRQPLAMVDRVRAQVAFYPGYVFKRGPHQYRVVEQAGIRLAEREPAPVFTLPIQETTLTLENWQPAQTQIAGLSNLAFGVGDVVVTIEVSGVKRFSPAGTPLVTQQFAPNKATYQSRAAILTFNKDDATPQVLHGLVHLCRATLPLALRHTDTDVSVVPHRDDQGTLTGIAVVDLHPFGAGFADAITPGILLKLFQSAEVVLQQTPILADATFCQSPHPADAPDLEGLEALLERFLSQ